MICDVQMQVKRDWNWTYFKPTFFRNMSDKIIIIGQGLNKFLLILYDYDYAY